MIRPRDNVRNLKRYVAPLEGRRQKLRLDFNENTQGPSPAVMEAIRQLPPNAYSTYPEYAGLESAFGDYLGVSGHEVAAFNGVDAAIRAVFDAYGEQGATFLTTAPTFAYYLPCAAQQGMMLTAIPYEADLSFPMAAFREALAAVPRLCFICNPNNPTGTWLAAAPLMELVRSAPETLFVIDELYADFVGESVVQQAVLERNVIVLRSLSKAFGLAALRIGVAAGHPELLEGLRCVIGPYDINMFAVVAARAALADLGHVEAYVQEVRVARDWTVAELGRLGVRYFCDQGNYMLVWPPGDVEQVVNKLSQQGILVRSMHGKPLIDGSFRLTVGTREQMARFMRVFAAIL